MQGVKINQVEFNIGLKNNPLEPEEIKTVMKGLGFNIFGTTPHYIFNGQYLGDVEPTFVITSSTTMDENAIHAAVASLAEYTTQACIAILLNNSKGELIYHPNYTAKRQEFNHNYFIDGYNKTYGKNFK